MSFFQFFRARSTTAVVVNVASHSIQGVLLDIPSSAHTEAPLRIIKEKVAKEISRAEYAHVFSQLRTIVHSLLRGSEHLPGRMYIGYSPPFVEQSCETITHHFSGKKNGISPHDIRGLIHRFISGRAGKDSIVKAAVLGGTVNGYTIPEDLLPTVSVDEIRVQLLLSRFPKKSAVDLASVKRELSGVAIDIVPLLFAEQETVVHALGVFDNTLLVDIGGAVTTLAFFHEGSIAGVMTYPIGADHFYKKFGEATGRSPKEAERDMRLLGESAVDTSRLKKTSEELRAEIDAWKKEFLRSTAAFGRIGPFSGRVLVTGVGAHISGILSFLRSSEWIRHVSYVDMPRVKILVGRDAFGGNSLEGNFRGPEDFGLASLAWYAGRRARKDAHLLMNVTDVSFNTTHNTTLTF